MAVVLTPSHRRRPVSIARLGWIPAFAGMTALLLCMSACGVKRPLVRPSDVPIKKQQQETAPPQEVVG